MSETESLRTHLEAELDELVSGHGLEGSLTTPYCPGCRQWFYTKPTECPAVLRVNRLRASVEAALSAARQQGCRDAADAVSAYRDELLASFGDETTLAHTMSNVAREWLTIATDRADAAVALGLGDQP